MTSGRSFFNRGVIRQELRQHFWVAVVYAMGLLLTLPLGLILQRNPGESPVDIDNLMQVNGGETMLFVLSLPVAAGLLITRYLQHKGAADATHSLPLRRGQLLASKLAAGVLLLLPPVWLTTLVAGFPRYAGDGLYLYGWNEVWTWGASVTILTLFLFTFTVFVGICLGQTILQGLVVYIMLILPALLGGLFGSLLSSYLYGFRYDGWWRNRDLWSPFYHMWDSAYSPFGWGELMVYLVLAVCWIVLSGLFYRKRPVERAGQAIVFTYLRPPFMAGVMLCSMMLAGSYLGDQRQDEPGWTIAGFGVGAALGCIVAEMVIRRSFHIFNRKLLLRFAGYTAVIGGLLYFCVSPLNGYENRVPAMDRIEGVYAGSNYESYITNGRNSYPASASDAEIGGPFRNVDPFSADPAYIESVRRLHKTLVVTRPKVGGKANYSANDRTFYYTIAYKLKNGSTLVRSYLIPLKGYEPELTAVMEAEPFKKLQYTVPELDKKLASIQLSAGRKSVSIWNPDDIRELTALLKEEILKMSLDEQIDDRVSTAQIQVIPEESVGKPYSFLSNFEWKPSYRKLGAWLEQKGYADAVRIRPEEIVSVELAKLDDPSGIPAGKGYDPAAYMKLAQSKGMSVTSEDKAVYGDIMARYRDFKPEAGSCLVLIKMKSGDDNYYRLRTDDLTPRLRALLP